MIPEPAITSELYLLELMFALKLEIVRGPQPEQLERHKSNGKQDPTSPLLTCEVIVNKS